MSFKAKFAKTIERVELAAIAMPWKDDEGGFIEFMVRPYRAWIDTRRKVGFVARSTAEKAFSFLEGGELSETVSDLAEDVIKGKKKKKKKTKAELQDKVMEKLTGTVMENLHAPAFYAEEWSEEVSEDAYLGREDFQKLCTPGDQLPVLSAIESAHYVSQAGKRTKMTEKDVLDLLTWDETAIIPRDQAHGGDPVAYAFAQVIVEASQDDALFEKAVEEEGKESTSTPDS